MAQSCVVAMGAAVLLNWGCAWLLQSPAPASRVEREVEATRQEERRRRLRDHVAALRAALAEADARKEPFRRLALEEVRRQASEVAITPSAWGEPDMRQLLDELAAATQREGERATAEELVEGVKRLLPGRHSERPDAIRHVEELEEGAKRRSQDVRER